MSFVTSSEKLALLNPPALPLALLSDSIPDVKAEPLKYHPAHPRIIHELMAKEVRDILFVSSPYNIINLVESGELEAKFIHEYRGLHLGHPPRITGVSTAAEALWLMRNKRFDLVLIAPHPEEPDILTLGIETKKIERSVPVMLLLSGRGQMAATNKRGAFLGVDKTFIWSGSMDLLLALIKNTEDHLNADIDTQKADIPVLILVEDSPEYYSFFLPVIYKEIARQTQALIDVGLNERKKLLIRRARPKVLLATDFEEATALYRKYRSFLLGVISDTRLPRGGETDPFAGVTLLSKIRKDIPELPLLMMSSESENQEKAEKIPAVFMDKNTPDLVHKIHHFFLPHMGFGDFIFRTPDGRIIERATDLLSLEATLSKVPDESIYYHAERNHFSNWLMARSEIGLALKYRAVRHSDFSSADELRQYLISSINTLRKESRKGIVSTFNPHSFDSTVGEFDRIGQGSMGGKARGIAFMSALLRQHTELHRKYAKIDIRAPKTLVICTDIFESFVDENHLRCFARPGFTDEQIEAAFIKAELPESLVRKLETYLMQVCYPLSIRSSRQMEDTGFQPYKRLYRSCMLSNTHDDLSVRLAQLTCAIKRVYASTFFSAPKAVHKNAGNQPVDESMAVILQQLVGSRHGDYFYPAVSGAAASYNFYPFSHMKPEEGLARMALGFAENVLDSDRVLRFSPRYPNIVPQFSSVEGTLRNSQSEFYALKINSHPAEGNPAGLCGLVKRDLDAAKDEFPVKTLTSTYCLQENRIRDCCAIPGVKVLTFASLLKYGDIQISELLCDLLTIGQKGLGCPVEIDFSINLYPESERKCEFFILQIRPMAVNAEKCDPPICEAGLKNALCVSSHALGHGIDQQLIDIIYVKPDTFEVDKTVRIADEIRNANERLLKLQRPYLLVGPGRWGTSDRWLGIPVTYRDISGAGAIIELQTEKLTAEPSKGSHFFNHITSKGVPYITIKENFNNATTGRGDFFDWQQLASLSAVFESTLIRHVQLKQPLMLQIDGRTSQCVIVRG